MYDRYVFAVVDAALYGATAWAFDSRFGSQLIAGLWGLVGLAKVIQDLRGSRWG